MHKWARNLLFAQPLWWEHPKGCNDIVSMIWAFCIVHCAIQSEFSDVKVYVDCRISEFGVIVAYVH